MIPKGTMIPVKKVLGWIIGIIGILLIFFKEQTLSFIDKGFFIGNFYFSILSILLIITAYFFIIAGRKK